MPLPQPDTSFVLILTPDHRHKLAEECLEFWVMGLDTNEIADALTREDEWDGLHESHVANALAWLRDGPRPDGMTP